MSHIARLFTTVGSLCTAIALLAGCHASVAGSSPATPPPAQVTVAEVIHRPLQDWTEFTGRLEAVQTVDIRPRVSGYVDRVAFEEGARVKKGQLLFRIDPRPFRAEVDRQGAARARAAAELDLARDNHARAQRLVEQNAIAREEFERLLSADTVAVSDVAAATAGLDAARLNLEFTEVRAPIDGRVSRALITLGNLVSSDSVLTTLVSDDPVYASFDTDEQTYLRYARSAARRRVGGDPVFMGLADEKEYPHAGRLNFVDNQLDRRTGTIRTRAVFDNPDGLFTPGLFVRIRLVGHDTRDAILIEDRAVGTDLGKNFVLVLKGDGTLDYRSVTLGAEVDGLRIVDSGLEAGEVIVVNGLQHVRPGAAVKASRVAMAAGRAGLRQVAGPAPLDAPAPAAAAAQATPDPPVPARRPPSAAATAPAERHILAARR